MKSKKPCSEDSEVVFEGSITHEQLSNFLSDKIMEMFGNTPEGGSIDISTNIKKEKKIKYKVVKRFKGSDIGTTLQTFDSIEEAQNFIKDLNENYPEAVANCDIFLIRYNAE